MDKEKIKKLRNRVIGSTIIIIAIIGGLRTYDDLKRNQEVLENKNQRFYKDINYIYQEEIDKIKRLITQNLTLITKSPQTIKSYKNKDKEALYNYAKPFYDSIKNVLQGTTRMHFHDKNHISFLRVHKKHKSGDNLKLVRPMITHAIEEQKITVGYEHGKHDYDKMTFRMAFPIFDKDEFLGVVEIGTDTNYINDKLEKVISDIYDRDTMVINIIKEDTINFDKLGDYTGKINGYRYRNSENIDHIIKNAQDTISDQIVEVDENVYSLQLSDIKLYNSRDKIIGNYFYIVDITKDIEENKMFFLSSLAKPIIATILLVLLVGWVFLYFYKNFLVLERRTRAILDAQSSLVVLSNGEKILDTNITMLEYYGFENLDQFRQKFDCICDSFEEGADLLQKYDEDGFLWIEQLMKDDKKIYKAGIKDRTGKLNIFSIVLNTYSLDTRGDKLYYVVTLTNISDLERANTQLIEQSKQASLGEMIGNISHQWRQPLSTISSIASGIKLRFEFGKFDIKELTSEMDAIVNKAKYLSETIDTFRNFIKEKKERRDVILQDRIDVALGIVQSAVTDNHIELIKDIDYDNGVKINLVIGELSQVIINIINNSKDAIVINGIEKGFIKISLQAAEKEATITIEDNGGGIKEEIIKKVFDPYFTTKHQSQGTGLGLYMSYKIVTESLHGKLYVENTDRGVKFFIKLPLS